MKKIVYSLLLGFLVGCSQVNNPTVIIPEANKNVDNTKKETVVKDVVVNNTTKPDVKVEVKESIKPITDPNAGIKDSVKYILTGVDKAVENLPSPTPYPIVTQTPIPTSSPAPVVIPSPTPIPDPRANDLKDTVPAGVSIYVPTPAPTKVPYRIDYPIVEKENASYELVFKDEYKVRYDKDKKQFYSLLGNDLKSVNDIFIKDNIIVYVDNDSNWTEEFMDNIEKREQDKGYEEDVPHYGSKYGLYATNITSVRELILKGRENIFVRQFNVYPAIPNVPA